MANGIAFDANGMGMSVGHAERLRITPDGVLGVGTTTPTLNGAPIAHFVTPGLYKADPRNSGRDVAVFGTADETASLAVSIGIRQSTVPTERYGFINTFELALASRALVLQNLGGTVGIGEFSSTTPDLSVVLHVKGSTRTESLVVDNCLTVPVAGIGLSSGQALTNQLDILGTGAMALTEGIRLIRSPSTTGQFGIINMNGGRFSFIASLAEVGLHGQLSFESWNGTTRKTMMTLDGETGTKIGTVSTEKLGFWGATPVTQPVLPLGSTTDAVIGLLQAIGLCRDT